MKLLKTIIDMLPYNLRKKLSDFFGNIEVYNRPGFFLLPGSNSKYQIKGYHQEYILDIIQPGDVLLRKFDHYVSGYGIPGYWDHVALCVGPKGEDKYKYRIIHMIGDGIAKESIMTFMRCDDMSILRCDNDDLKSKAISNAINDLKNNIKYDYSMNFMNNRNEMVCTESVWYWYGQPKFNSDNTIVINSIMPDDMYNSIWYTVWGGLRSEGTL